VTCVHCATWLAPGVLLIPALAMAEIYRQRGELNEANHQGILQSLEKMIHERDEDQPQAPTQWNRNDAARVTILGLPACTKADEITASMLAQVLRSGS
jgi:hypothetical protein